MSQDVGKLRCRIAQVDFPCNLTQALPFAKNKLQALIKYLKFQNEIDRQLTLCQITWKIMEQNS
jgi:hypothetical protein